MKVLFNGKPIAGAGTDDEPPPAFHVFKRLIGTRVSSVHLNDQGFQLDLIREDGSKIEVLSTVSLERNADDDGYLIELVAAVTT